MSRTIAILGLTQVSVVVLGFFALSIFLKQHGYPNEPFAVLHHYRWTWGALAMRRYGLFLLLLPMTWTALTAIAEIRSRFVFSFFAWLLIGVILLLITIALFVCAMVWCAVFAE